MQMFSCALAVVSAAKLDLSSQVNELAAVTGYTIDDQGVCADNGDWFDEEWGMGCADVNYAIGFSIMNQQSGFDTIHETACTNEDYGPGARANCCICKEY